MAFKPNQNHQFPAAPYTLAGSGTAQRQSRLLNQIHRHASRTPVMPMTETNGASASEAGLINSMPSDVYGLSGWDSTFSQMPNVGAHEYTQPPPLPNDAVRGHRADRNLHLSERLPLGELQSIIDGLHECTPQLLLLRSQGETLCQLGQNVLDTAERFEEWSISLFMTIERVMGPEGVEAAQQSNAAQRTNATQ